MSAGLCCLRVLLVIYFCRTGYSLGRHCLRADPRKLGESAFAKTMQMLDFSALGFIDRPIAAFLILAAVATVANGIWREVRAHQGRRMLID